jgi:hypothetical protein
MVPSDVLPSKNVTLPVARPLAVETVAVIVTALPTVTEFDDTASVVELAMRVTVTPTADELLPPKFESPL